MPTLQKYLDFDLEILRDGDAYRAHVINSPGGQGSAPFKIPFSDEKLENLILRMGLVRAKTRSAANTRLDAAKELGGALFQAVYTGDVARCWDGSLTAAHYQNANLRVRLRLDSVPELAELPWEYLYAPAPQNRFFHLSPDTPLVHFLESNLPLPTLEVTPPLNILLMAFVSRDQMPLDIDAEESKLNTALAQARAHGVVTLTRLPRADLDTLQDALLEKEYHILHFIGHGEFDVHRERGYLILEGDNGYGERIEDERFARMIGDHDSLRLVMLNSCEGARPTRTDAFGGVAQRLIQQGVPAVIAMQFEITDDAALAFSRKFYTALGLNRPLEAALAEGRKGIYAKSDTEWGTPVLYSRAPDGILFDIRGAPTAPPPTKTETTVPLEPATETLTYDELMRRATAAQKRGEQLWNDTPTDEQAWRAKFQDAFALLERAEKLRRDDIPALLQMAQVRARLDTDTNAAKALLLRVEDLIGEPMNDDLVRKLGEAYFLHANLSAPPNEKLLARAREQFERLNDFKMQERIDALLHRAARPNAKSLGDFYDETAPKTETDFNPLGKWNIQVQDMVGSRLLVDLASNGTFQMNQQVGMYQVPVNGSWTFNPLTKQLALNGVVNTFQPFTLSITISGKLPNGYAAVGNDGIGYVLTRG